MSLVHHVKLSSIKFVLEYFGVRDSNSYRRQVSVHMHICRTMGVLIPAAKDSLSTYDSIELYACNRHATICNTFDSSKKDHPESLHWLTEQMHVQKLRR